MRPIQLLTLGLTTVFGLVSAPHAIAGIFTFGSGANQFSMEFVTVGSAGNLADGTGNPSPAGSVGYVYEMGKFEVSRDMIAKASNLGSLGITLADMTSFGGNGANKPATGITWLEAAQFVNWLNTNQGYQAAYKFNSSGAFELWQIGDVGFNPANPFRNSLAKFVLPTSNEWYKAAFYDPVAGVYYDHATGSNSPPVGVASGTAAGTAVWQQPVSQGPADVTQAGGLSPFGTIGQAGNVWEWEETEFDLVNNSATARRGIRGGIWYHFGAIDISASTRGVDFPQAGNANIDYGFRVVSLSASSAAVPEPSSLCLALGGLGLAAVGLRRRRSRAVS